jgi:hypothetical protein
LQWQMTAFLSDGSIWPCCPLRNGQSPALPFSCMQRLLRGCHPLELGLQAHERGDVFSERYRLQIDRSMPVSNSLL